MLKQIQDAIRFIKNYPGVCSRRDRRERSVVEGGGGRVREETDR